MNLRIFIGMDSRQPIAYNVAAYSVAMTAGKPVAVTPLILSQLPIKRRGLTDFTYGRYTVPWLCDFEGIALFMDPDTLVRRDIYGILPLNVYDILPLGVDLPAVSVVPHTTVTKEGQSVSVVFERNAVMLFNCAKCRTLTPEWIDDQANAPNKISSWAGDIGQLEPRWNHLVGYDQPNPDAAIAHFTMGIPCFPETTDDEFGDEWRAMHKQMNGTVSWKSIMGPSVHAHWKMRK
jgi:hypothetical protein